MKTITFIILIFFSSTVYCQAFKSKNFEIKKLRTNIYAAIASQGGNAVCNAGVINLGDDVLVIDPFLTPAAAMELKQFIATVIKKPVKYVVDTHSHNDHIRGNQVFASATIIATPLIRQTIEKAEPEDIADEKIYVPGRIKYYDSIPLSKDKWQAEEDAIWRGYFKAIAASHSILKTTLPNLVFNDSLTIYGNTEVRLITYGDGHSASDVFVYLSKEKIVFAGDLLFVKNHPWIGESKDEDWSNYLKKLLALNADIYIPGHGPEGNKSSVTDMINYFTALNNSADKLRSENNLTTKQINDRMPAEYKEWHYRNFYSFNIKYLLKK